MAVQLGLVLVIAAIAIGLAIAFGVRAHWNVQDERLVWTWCVLIWANTSLLAGLFVAWSDYTMTVPAVLVAGLVDIGGAGFLWWIFTRARRGIAQSTAPS